MSLESAGLHIGRADADLGAAFLDAAHDVRARALLQIEPHEIVDLEEARQIVGQEFDDGRQIGEHAHMAANAARMFAKLNGDLLDIDQRDPRMMQQRFTCRRQCHAARLPFEQGDLQRLFEIMQAFADRGRRNPLALRGAGEIGLFADGDEELQGGEIDPPYQAGGCRRR